MSDNNITIYLSLTSSPSSPRSELSIDSSSSITPAELHKQASDVTSIPSDKLKLIYRGKLIPGNKNTGNVITEFKLEDLCVVHVMGKPAAVMNGGDGGETTSSGSNGVANGTTSVAGASVTLPNNMNNISSNAASSSPLTAALAKLQSSNDGPTYRTALSTADKLLGNIVTNPNEPKYRSIKKNNPAFVKRLGAVVGGHDLLLASGFVIEVKEEDEIESIEYYVLKPSETAWPTLVTAREEVGRRRVLAEGNSNNNAPRSGMPGGGTPAFGGAGAAGMMPPAGGMGGGGAPDMRMMQQMLNNPDMIQNMMNNPMVQNMMRNDPRLANNPMLQQSLQQLQNNPQMASQMAAMMSDPNMQQQMANMMQQGVGAGGGGGGMNVAPDLAAMQRQMAQFQQQMGGGLNNPRGAGTGGSGTAAATGSTANANASTSSTAAAGNNNDREMTEEEMIAEAIARSLRES